MEQILGIKIDNLEKNQILEKIHFFLSEDNFHQIATINQEFILEARKNAKFKDILNACNLNIADSFGVKLAFLRYGKLLKYRMAGADLMAEILQMANAKKLKIFLAAKNGGLSSWEETRNAILKTYPNLEINGANINIEKSYEFQVSSCEIVFCNFGAPYQEIFLNSLKGDKIRLAMGVGGSFDYLTGKTPRAPRFLRQMGLEWLWRLALQPKRWKRIFNAVIVFPIKVILNK